jgi:hypothetical protein
MSGDTTVVTQWKVPTLFKYVPVTDVGKGPFRDFI